MSLDEVAYVRFASVYRSFQDVGSVSRRDRAHAHSRCATPKASCRCGLAATPRRNSRVHCLRRADDAASDRARRARSSYHSAQSLRRLRHHSRRTHRRRRLASQVGRAARRSVGVAGGGRSGTGATVYVTLEPHSYQSRTPPCTDALIRSGRASRCERRAGCESESERRRCASAASSWHRRRRWVCLRRAARELNLGFEKRMTTGLPRCDRQIRDQSRWAHRARERREQMDHR